MPRLNKREIAEWSYYLAKAIVGLGFWVLVFLTSCRKMKSESSALNQTIVSDPQGQRRS